MSQREHPSTMRAIRLHAPGTVDDLVTEILEVPKPTSHEVLVQVHAAALTRDELTWVTDRLPAIPSYELSGTVVSVGKGVRDLTVGTEVFGMTPFDRDGCAAEYLALDPELVAPKPSSLSHVEAAALPLPALSAMQGLFDHGHLEKNQRVLVHGGGGGVGGFAVQLARRAGAYVIATASRDRVAAALALGADEVIDATKSDVGGIGPVDLVFDTAGGERLARSIDLLQAGKRLVSVAEEPPADLCEQGGVEGIYFVVEPSWRQLEEVLDLARQGGLLPRIDRTYPLEDARSAFRRSVERAGNGKVVLTVNKE